MQFDFLREGIYIQYYAVKKVFADSSKKLRQNGDGDLHSYRAISWCTDLLVPVPAPVLVFRPFIPITPHHIIPIIPSIPSISQHAITPPLRSTPPIQSSPVQSIPSNTNTNTNTSTSPVSRRCLRHAMLCHAMLCYGMEWKDKQTKLEGEITGRV